MPCDLKRTSLLVDSGSVTTEILRRTLLLVAQCTSVKIPFWTNASNLNSDDYKKHLSTKESEK